MRLVPGEWERTRAADKLINDPEGVDQTPAGRRAKKRNSKASAETQNNNDEDNVTTEDNGS